MSLPPKTVPRQAPNRDPLSREVLLTNVRRALFGEETRTTQIGPYEVKRRLGGGAMGSIFESYDPRLKRSVALKLVDTDTVSAAAASLMTREARALARIEHPNVVTIFDAGECELGVWVGMELLVGQNLERWLRRSPRPPVTRTLRILTALGHALTAVHAAGLVHRDVKPANAFLTDADEVKLVDFGLALAETEAMGSRTPGDEREPTAQAHHKRLSGTPAYMAPEQHRCERATPSSDQYAWCVMAWEALYGERPFSAVELDPLYRLKLESRLSQKPLHTDVPARVHAAVLRGLAPDPADRWPTMADLLGQCAVARPRPWLAYAGLAAGLAGLAAWSLSSTPAPAPCPSADVWDADAREGVRAALVGGGSRFRRETWDRVEPRLEAHATAYEQLRGETCRALHNQTLDADTADGRLDCLARWKTSFDRLTGTLRAVDESGVAGAIGRTIRLDDPLACAELETQQATSRPPPPKELRGPVTAIRTRIQAAETKMNSGQFAEVLRLLRGLKRDASALQFPPLNAEVHYLEARTFTGLGRTDDAEAAFLDAHHGAQRSSHAYTEAASAVGLIDLALRRDDFETAQTWIRHGQAGPHAPWPKFAVVFLTYESVVLGAQGRTGDALKAALRAVELSSSLGPTDQKYTAMYGAVGRLLDAGRADEAYALGKRGVEEQQSVFGSQHPTLVTGLSNLALAAWEAGDADASISTFERVTALRRTRAGGAPHPGEAAATLAIDLINFAGRLATLERWDEAEAKLEEALPHLEATFPPGHPLRGVAAVIQGDTARGLQDYEAALGHFERARVIAEEASGADDEIVGWAFVGKGLTLLEMGDVHAADARSALERGWPLLQPTTEDAQASPTGERSVGPFALARATWASGGSRESAVALAHEARALAGGSHPVAVSMATKIDAWLLEHPVPSAP